jgi:integrase
MCAPGDFSGGATGWRRVVPETKTFPGYRLGYRFVPKPLLLRRPSGLYARFLLPADIRPLMGTRFVVRSLRGQTSDIARLRAAQLGYALAAAIEGVRSKGGKAMDAKKLIEAALAAASRGDIKRYELTIPGVVSLKTDGPEDHARAMDALEQIGRMSDLEWKVPLPPPSTALSGPMLHAAVDRFLKDFCSTGRAEATQLETNHSLALFRDLTDDVPVSELAATHIDHFRDGLAHWPARARVLPAFKGLTARAIVEKAKGQGLSGLKVRTVEKHLDRLRVFFNSLVQRGELARNPLTGLRLQTRAAKYESARRGFEPEELLLLFDPELRGRLAADDPMNFWVPVLMLYTGARMNELVSLDVKDLDSIEGVWGVHITKYLKNPQSKRFVPLPQRVLDLGLQTYAEDVKAAGFSELFPGGSETAKNGRGDKLSKWFNRTFLRKACGILGTDVCLQSFRNTLMTAADRVGISEAQMNPLVGHGARSLQQKHYIDKPTLPERQQRIEWLAMYFRVPPLAMYRAGQFDAYLGELRRTKRRAEAVALRSKRQQSRSEKPSFKNEEGGDAAYSSEPKQSD